MRTREDQIFEGVVLAILLVLCFTMLYPCWNTLVVSLNQGTDTMRGGITFWPRAFSLENYSYVFKDSRILNAFAVSIARTFLGTALSVIITSLFAYSLTKKQLKLRKLYMWLAVFTMYFGGGMIPSFLIIRALGLRNTLWVLIVPGAVSVYNMIIFRTFFQGVPASLEESARIDGASYYCVFFRILLPVSKPVFATLALFTAVGHWNAWFDAAIYISDKNLMPIQNLLKQIINSNSMSEMTQNISGSAANYLSRTRVTTTSLMAATVVVATLPILLVYPFVQKYFVQGVMIGSLKE